jgi:hypothetical protein
MSTLPNILLVEGEADRGFFEALCRMWGIAADVRVATPKDTAGGHNSKQGVLSHLTTVLLPQLQDGACQRIGLVVDADRVAHGTGYANTLQRFLKALAQAGYHQNSASSDGLVFSHDDGLADLGLWIMPNNADEGMLEDWVKQCVHPEEAALFQHASHSIDAIPGGPKFSQWHRTKAEVATWLAWQKKPEHGLYLAVQPSLLNVESPLLKELQAWLGRVFAP